MTEVMTLSIVAIAAVATGVVVWAIMSQREARKVEAAMSEGNAEIAATKARLDAITGEKESLQKDMENAFKLAADQAFKKAVKDADEAKESSFQKATGDLSKSLSDYIKAIEAVDKADAVRVKGLEKDIEAVSNLGMTLSNETRELSLALRGDSQAQGAWGEVVVENLLQSMGFVEGRDYIKQETERGKDGEQGKRADFILNLPDNRQVVIDSKVSLTAYTEYVNAEDDESSNSAMKAHCTSIRGHATKLSSKNYEHMESINTLDFVLMVVPLEGAFIDAMRADPSLYEDLVGDRRVKVVSGTSLMLALLLIQELWTRENQTRNQVELVKRAGALHDKVVNFLESFTTVGFELGQATTAFEKARDQLTDGAGNVIKQTEMLRQLGAKVKKDLRSKSGVRQLAEESEDNARFAASEPADWVIVEAEEE